jgi:hypothetical protein
MSKMVGKWDGNITELERGFMQQRESIQPRRKLDRKSTAWFIVEVLAEGVVFLCWTYGCYRF